MGFESEAREKEEAILNKDFFKGKLAKIIFHHEVNPTFAVNFKLGQSVLFHPRMGLESDGSIGFRYKTKSMTISQVYRNDATIRSTLCWNVEKWLKNTHLRLSKTLNTAKDATKGSAKVSVKNHGEHHNVRLEYRDDERRFLLAKLLLSGACKCTKKNGAPAETKSAPADPKASKGSQTTPAAVVVEENPLKYGFGLGLAYNLDRKDFSVYKGLFFARWQNLGMTAVARCEKVGFAPEKFLMALWHKVNDQTDVAANLEHNVIFNQTRFFFGFQSKLNDNLTVKVKLDDHFKTDTAWIYKITPGISLSVATKHDLKPSREKLIDTIIPFGIRLHINE